MQVTYIIPKFVCKAHTNLGFCLVLSRIQTDIIKFNFYWLILLSKVANSWWGTKATLPILYAAGVPSDWAATHWQEFEVLVAHYGGSPAVVAPVSVPLLSTMVLVLTKLQM
jgi:hypothetical protein